MIQDDMLGATPTQQQQAEMDDKYFTTNLSQIEYIIGEQVLETTSSLYDNVGASSSYIPTDLSGIPSGDLFNPNNEIAKCLNDFLIQDSKTNIRTFNIFPNLEEHDNCAYNFEMNLYPQKTSKNNWLYSQLLQRVYIKLNQTFHIDAMYKQKSQKENLFVRAMMIFIDEVSAPVCRCHNHSNNDPETLENIKYSVLRSENPDAQYRGCKDGKNISDRLSILIPLSYVTPNEHNMAKQTIALKFVCQNSCIGRRSTAVIFTLENEAGEVFSKRVVNVKICSCPNRDKVKEEKKEKGGLDDLDCPPGKRLKKEIKKEEADSNALITPPPSVSPPTPIQSAKRLSLPSSMPGVQVNLSVPSNEFAFSVAEFAFNKISGQMALEPARATDLSKYLRIYKRLLDQFSEPTNSDPN